MKINKTHNQQWFTLIELLVVITIIGILAVGGTGIYTTQMQWARDSNRVTNMQLISDALIQYYADKGAYPTQAASADISTTFPEAIKVYNSNFPKDPKAGVSACWVETWYDAATATETTVKAGQPCKAYYFETEDTYHLPHSIFKIATHLEKQTNVEAWWIARTDLAKTAGWIDGLFEKFAGNWWAGITFDQLKDMRIQ